MAGSLDFIATWRVYFDVVMCIACVFNSVYGLVVWWVASTVVTIIIGMFNIF